MVVEVGTSESQDKLEEDAWFWLARTGRAVRWVLTLKYHEHRMLLCSWTEISNDMKPQGMMQATLQDGVYTILPSPDLWVPFSDIFLREPCSDEPSTIRLTAQAFLAMLNGFDRSCEDLSPSSQAQVK